MRIIMPIYEYQCTACNKTLEKLQKMNDEPLRECPVCHQATLRKLMSAAGFQLKGSGWYVTDFKDSGKKKPESKDNSSKTGDKKDSGTTSEKKTSAPKSAD